MLLVLLLAITLIVIASFTGAIGESAMTAMGYTLLKVGIIALLWLLAAVGFGAWFLRWLPPELSKDVGPGTRLLAAIGLGIPAQLFIVSVLGTLGVLTMTTAWGLVAIGIFLLGFAIRTSSHSLRIGPSEGWLPPFTWTAAPALAVIALASLSAPGWLWQTEFGGYDALSYHLQLPREWFEAGRMFTPTWNVYGALPSLVEGGYYHLMVLEGHMIPVALSAQFLHACFAIVTAAITGAAAGRWLGAPSMGAGFALLIGTPWVIVVGSLAYNEMAVALMLATALLLFVPSGKPIQDSDTQGRMRIGIAAGFLAGAACAAKLTAIGFVALPIVYLLIRRVRSIGWRDAVPLGALAGLVVLAPWLIRNFEATGNPLFPFASGFFGTGHFSDEQITRFAAAHASTEGLLGRVGHFWDQFVRFGIGTSPLEPNEIWRPQWSLLPFLTIAGLLVGLIRPSTRRIARDLLILTVVPCVFWLAATHLKSRFLVPAIPIFVLAATMLVPQAIERKTVPARVGKVIIALFLLAWCILPVWLFKTERSRDGRSASAAMVGRMDLATGLYFIGQAKQQQNQEQATQVLRMGGSTAWMALMPKQEKILAIGNATPFLTPRPYTYTTVWDTNPIAPLLEEHSGDTDAVITALREKGYTALLINPVMLQIWETSGWLDPRLNQNKLSEITRKLPLEQSWPNGELLLRIQPPSLNESS